MGGSSEKRDHDIGAFLSTYTTSVVPYFITIVVGDTSNSILNIQPPHDDPRPSCGNLASLKWVKNPKP